MPPKRCDIPTATLKIQGETLVRQLKSLTYMVEAIDTTRPSANRKGRALNHDIDTAKKETASLMELMSYSSDFSDLQDIHRQLLELKLNLSVKYQELMDDEPQGASTESVKQLKHLQLHQFLLTSVEPFEGDILKFESFRTQYDTAVHKLAIPSHIKMTALRQLVSGPAGDFLNSYGTSQNDYENAYKELVAKYTSKRRVAEAVLERFNSIPSCSDSSKLVEIEKFKDAISATYQSLKNLEIPDLAEFLLFTSSKLRLPCEVQGKLHEQVGDTLLPNVADLLQFLESQISKTGSRDGSLSWTQPSKSHDDGTMTLPSAPKYALCAAKVAESRSRETLPSSASSTPKFLESQILETGSHDGSLSWTQPSKSHDDGTITSSSAPQSTLCAAKVAKSRSRETLPSFASSTPKVIAKARNKSFQLNNRRKRNQRKSNHETAIVAATATDPSTSDRRISGEAGFGVTNVPNLLPKDPAQRLEFCNWYRTEFNHRDANILWTDVATFTRNGVTDQPNTYFWSAQNPHASTEFRVNVWVGMTRRRFFGPVVLPDRLNANAFRTLLDYEVFDILENMPLQERRGLWFQMGRCPAYDGRVVTEWMNTHFKNRWIGTRGPVTWPPRSPDLTPLSFSYWGALKSMVYEVRVDTRPEMVDGIISCAETLRANHDVLARAVDSMHRRAELCIRENGGHFEQHLK